MNKIKLAHYISTGLLSAMMCMSAGMYIFKNADIQMVFTKMGYPTYIIYPLAFFKICGVVMLWLKKPTTLHGMAYAGFFFNFVLAFFAHLMIGDGEQFGGLLALILLGTSYFSFRKLN